MSASLKRDDAQAFFLAADPGQRFCLFHPPAGECRGAILYVHPFGDEMNKSRRMAALQARALADAGFGVLQIDLYGCGDSSGEFSEARWEIWKHDLAAGCAWLDGRLGQPVTLWGLRLGALLALDYAQSAEHRIEALLMWQPVSNGSMFLAQFLRLLTARAIVAAGTEAAGAVPAADLRKQLLSGQMLEVAGYELAPALAAAIDSSDFARLGPPRCPLYWLETAAAPGRAVSPAVDRLVRDWREQGADVQLHQVQCAPFWSTQEIEEAPALLAATTAMICKAADELSRASA